MNRALGAHVLPSPSGKDCVLAFGEFQLSLNSMRLSKRDQLVPLGSRALAILSALISRRGEVVSHEELIAIGWPDVTVLQDNLRVQIAGLRRALGDGNRADSCIKTVPGRGYCFVKEVQTVESDGSPVRSRPPGRRTLPALITRIVGRAQAINQVEQSLKDNRLTTLVGPGGIGKTTVALAAVHESQLSGIFLDLSRISDFEGIVAALASALGVTMASDRDFEEMRKIFDQNELLLILDNCEHVIDHCARIAECLLGQFSRLKLLATSRYPLKVSGEVVRRLYPLDLPPRAACAMSEARSYPSVELLLERASMASEVELRDSDASSLVEICHRLDGIPLAIELAAAAIGVLGVRETAELLNRGFRSLEGGHRTAPSRQKTLWATFNWSYGLLSAVEQTVLRHLARFNGPTSFEELKALCCQLNFDDSTLVTALIQLAEKSLVIVDVSGEQALYSLLQVNREFARQMSDPEEARTVSTRLANMQVEMLRQAAADWRFENRVKWNARYSHLFDEAAASFSWSVSPAGDLTLAVELLKHGVPVLFYLSRMHLALSWAESLKNRVAELGADEERSRLAILVAYGTSYIYAHSATNQALKEIWTEVLRRATHANEPDGIMTAQWGLWVQSTYRGSSADAMDWAKSFLNIAETRSSPADLRLGRYMLASSLLTEGNLANARAQIDAALDTRIEPALGLGVIKCLFDPSVHQRVLKVRILWAQGYIQEALAESQYCVGLAEERCHNLTTCQALAEAMAQIAILSGRYDLAEQALNRMSELVTASGLGARISVAGLKVVLDVERGNNVDAATVGNLLEDRPNNGFPGRFPSLTGRLAVTLGKLGFLAAASQFLSRELARDASCSHWCRPENLRANAALSLLAQHRTEQAEADLHESLRLSNLSGAVSWELRAAYDLAEILRDRGSSKPACAVIDDVLSRVKDHTETADLQRIKRLRLRLAK